jgi:HdeA/HdeB family
VTAADALAEDRSAAVKDHQQPAFRVSSCGWTRHRGLAFCVRAVYSHSAFKAQPGLSWEGRMKFVISLGAIALLGAGAAHAQVDLTTYADAKGNLDVQKLTCAQLANTFQEDADFMTVWYSGWYNGLAGYSKLKVDRAKELEHRVIVYCKANPKTKVITAMDINIKQMRKELGIKVNDEK